jgi:hypothetical protein
LVFGRSKLTVVWNKSVGYISGLEWPGPWFNQWDSLLQLAATTEFKTVTIFEPFRSSLESVY